MNCLDGILESLDETNLALIEARVKPIEELFKSINNVVKNMNDAVDIYKKTGVAPEINFETWKTSLVFEDELQQLSSKENVRPDENAPTENTRRSRRNPNKQGAQNCIKKEKLSLLKVTSAEVPAPTKAASKKLKQKTSLFCINEETEGSLDSVIIQDVEIPIINLESDDEEGEEKSMRQSSRKTRRKRTENIVIKKEKQETVNKTEVKPKLQNKVKVDWIGAEECKKRTRFDSLSEGNEKKSKSNSDILEDSPPYSINDATFVLKPSINITPSSMNTTMVVENPKFLDNNNKLVEIEAIASAVIEVPRPNNIKLEGTGGKKKIQPSLESMKTSRIKTRGQAKEQGVEAVAVTPKICTPDISILANPAPKKATHPSQNSSSSQLITAKFAGELKASQAEYREREKKKALEERKPIYMTMKPPFLPTEDCYDSDDEERPKKLLKDPLWARSRSLEKRMFCLMAAGETIKNTFFSRKVETPDLLEIFEVIEPEKLKRSSSVIWHKPPRYTMMPVLDQYLGDNYEDEYSFELFC